MAAAVISALVAASATRADDTGTAPDINAELNALKTRITELEAQQNENWLTKERESQIRGIVDDVLKDAKMRGQFADGVETGYAPGSGFYIQTPDKNYKLNISGFAQIRYETSYFHATDGRTLPGRTVGSGTGSTSVVPPNPGNTSGVDIRRARISLAGNVFTPDLTFKLEGDFYGGSYVNSISNNSQTSNPSTGVDTFALPSAASGAFTVTDAFIAYRFNDLFKVKVGSFKIPFTKAELTTDTQIGFAERAEENFPFDPVRALGVSLYGDFVKDQLSYEINFDNGGNGNTYRRADTVGLLNNIDNRPSLYARLQWAGSGKISDFAEESDTRADNREFIWMLGAAGGYESQNATNTAFPSPSGGDSIVGLSAHGTSPGFISAYNLNGDLLRGTVDWSAKYQGLSINTAAYIQQINVNPGNTSATSGTSISDGPYGAFKQSFFEYGGYGQIGYFIIPMRDGKNGLEILGRAGVLGTEGETNIGEFYTVGANYYIFGNNFKIQTDVTYTPEAPYTDAGASLLQNTHDITLRVQAQIRF